MTYIFGNIIHQESPESFVGKLKTFRFKDDDKFVHLNKCVSFHYGYEFFRDKTNYSMHNTDSKWNTPMGFYDMLSDWKCFKESIFHRYRLKNEGGKLSIEDFNTGDIVNQHIKYETCPKYKYPDKGECNKAFTLGFYAYFFWRRYLKDAVRLINFYGTADKSYDDKISNKWHDLMFEENYFKRIGVEKIFI